MIVTQFDCKLKRTKNKTNKKKEVKEQQNHLFIKTFWKYKF